MPARLPVDVTLDSALLSDGHTRESVVGCDPADTGDGGVPRMVDVTRCELDLEDLTTSVINVRTNNETLSAAIVAVLNGDNVTGNNVLSVSSGGGGVRNRHGWKMKSLVCGLEERVSRGWRSMDGEAYEVRSRVLFLRVLMSRGRRRRS